MPAAARAVGEPEAVENLDGRTGTTTGRTNRLTPGRTNRLAPGRTNAGICGRTYRRCGCGSGHGTARVLW